MCAIAGILNLKDDRPPLVEEIAGMLGTMQHRGPDESGIYLDDRLALGHDRLSIIGLSDGAQPIHNEDQTLWVAFNGEIFNYPELKSDLLRKGHRFYTSTDTEVLVHLFEDYGVELLDRLNGQFAFALWDKRKNELFLARDRLGLLPLHYTTRGGRFVFASEIKALFALPEIPRELDPVAMDQIFTFWTTLKGRTAFRDIFEIPPGTYLRVNDRGIGVNKYWRIPCVSPERYLDWPEEKICEKLRDLVLDSVRVRLRADVKVGCYISGGLDSSAITAIVKNRFDQELRTFGIRFEDREFDESEFQNLIVAQLETDHTSFLAENRRLLESFAGVVFHCEKPMLRTAPVPLYLLSEIVHREGYKVVLTGEGADEAFCGYNIFKEAKIRAFCAKRPDSRWRPLLFGRIYPYVFRDQRLKKMASAFFSKGLDRTDDPLYSHLVRWENTARTKNFFSERLKCSIGDYSGYDEIREDLPPDFERLDVLGKAQYLEMSVFMSNYLLSTQGDRVAMAHSLELRPPFLDHRIVEFACQIPAALRMRGLREKYVLKQVFKDILPESVLNRPKQPYRAPIAAMFLAGGDMVREVLSDSSLDRADLFDKSRVKSLVAKLAALKKLGEIDSMALVGIVTSQLLHDRFVSGVPSPLPLDVGKASLFDHRTGSSRKISPALSLQGRPR